MTSVDLHWSHSWISSGHNWIRVHHWASFCFLLPLLSIPRCHSLQQNAEKNTKNPCSLCLCCWFDKFSTQAQVEDTKVVATARGHLSGFALRNLKHLTLFDHNLIHEEAMKNFHAGMAPILSNKFTLFRPHPTDDGVVRSLPDCISFSVIFKRAFILLLTVKTLRGRCCLFPHTFHNKNIYFKQRISNVTIIMRNLGSSSNNL